MKVKIRIVEQIFNFGLELQEEASSIILKNNKHIRKISYKGEHSNLVTNVDKEVEEFLIKKIRKDFLHHSIIAEESGIHKKDLENIWFIDPIDGTTNFAHGYPFFCISLAFSQKGKLQFGIVKNPITNELFTARKNKGARLNGKKISVSKIKNLKQSLLATGFPYSRGKDSLRNFKNFQDITLKSQGVRRDGAAALDLCYVACGKLDGFWESNLNPWDVAAGVLITKEAGGKITDFEGNDYNVFCDKIMASNGLVHEELLKYLR